MSTTRHFIYEEIAADLAAGRYRAVVTRFPPEPNGYLHIGHAKAICLDFGMAAAFGGRCHLRMDDTNPAKESMEYVEAIQRDIRWLGFDWGEHFYYAADYFERMYECAVHLIRTGRAYVCQVPQEEWKHYRGVPTEPGRESPYRNRPIEESLDLFARMRAGEFPDGSMCLRAKIDMASPNLHLRDPVLYRILRVPHYRTGNRWVIYPTYDFAHPLEDAFEGVTHSLCTLEFEVHRPLYDWVIQSCGFQPPPRQIEFARLNLTYTVMSKRRLGELVREGHVRGWDDPRLPTLCGMRRRGYPPEAIRKFCDEIGVTKYDSLTEYALLEHYVREVLNLRAPRRMAVLDPLKVVIKNFDDSVVREVEVPNNPENPAEGTRRIPFGRELWIERDDYRDDPPPDFYRLAPGRAVRLRGAGFFTCRNVVRDSSGRPIEIHGDWAPASARLKVRSTLHWVSVAHAVPIEVRLYDHLFTIPDVSAIPDDDDYRRYLNPRSLVEVRGWGEPALAATPPGQTVQFERLGYFCADSEDFRPDRYVFNRTVTLKDSPLATAGRG